MRILSHLKTQSILRKHSVFCLTLCASMTVYLTLVLVVAMALIFTLIESGRASAMRTAARSITYMAADSVFAEFAQPVFDDYGVMVLWKDPKDCQQTFDAYVSETMNLSDIGVGRDMDLYGLQFAGSHLQSVEWLVDADGKAFSEQVIAYMKVHAIESVAEDLLAKSGFFEQAEAAKKVMETIADYQDEFAKVEESAVQISEQMSRLKDLSENPKTLFEELEGAFDLWEAGEEDEAAALFSGKKEELRQSRAQLAEELTRAEEASENYFANVRESEQAIDRMKEEVAIGSEGMEAELSAAMQETVQNMEHTASSEGKGYEEIQENAAQAKAYQERLQGLDAFFAQTEAPLSQENAASYRELTQQYKEQTAGFSPVLSEEPPASSEEGAADLAFLDKINAQYEVGLLDFFAEDISAKAIAKESLPSVLYPKPSAPSEEDFVDKTIEKALFSSYITEHFGNYTKVKEETALDYEAEYILCGKESDRENLSDCVTKLVLLRCGVNYISLILDSSKQAQIKELATSISCGQVYVMKIAEFLITFAWVAAESMLDAKALLQGKRVPLLKQQDDWFFSLSGLLNFTGNEEADTDEKKGLSYEEYLRILLLLEKEHTQVFQTMDLIQANMCRNENAAFRMKDCFVGVVIEAAFAAPQVFADIWQQQEAFANGEGYRFTFLQSYRY